MEPKSYVNETISIMQCSAINPSNLPTPYIGVIRPCDNNMFKMLQYVCNNVNVKEPISIKIKCKMEKS